MKSGPHAMQRTHRSLAGRECAIYVKTAVPLHRNETNWQMCLHKTSAHLQPHLLLIMCYRSELPVLERNVNVTRLICLLLTLASAPTVSWHSNGFNADGWEQTLLRVILVHTGM